MRGFSSRRGPELTLVHSLGEAKVSQLIFTKAAALVFTDKATETRTVKHIQPHCHTKKRETEVSLSQWTNYISLIFPRQNYKHILVILAIGRLN